MLNAAISRTPRSVTSVNRRRRLRPAISTATTSPGSRASVEGGSLNVADSRGPRLVKPALDERSRLPVIEHDRQIGFRDAPARSGQAARLGDGLRIDIGARYVAHLRRRGQIRLLTVEIGLRPAI